MLLSIVVAAIVAVAMLAAPSGVWAQVRAPELSPNLGWLNTDRPLRIKEELKGHVIVLDFWTLGCINCIHILPDLEFLENKYKDEPVIIIGVHSAKFANESTRQSIRNAVQRYGVHHPVVIDDGMKIWDQYAIRGWPGFVVIDSAGMVIGGTGGEGQRALLDTTIAQALKDGRAKGTLAAKPFKPTLDASVPSAGGLAFPGKVIAVPPREGDEGWVFISDTAHHRVVAASWPDAQGRSKLFSAFGSGEPGLKDGLLRECRFFEPQGLAYDAVRKVVFVADRRNHAIREISLATGVVTTISGDGTQGRSTTGGNIGRQQRLSSPWDVALAPDGKTLYIAMAGPHQLWQLDVVSGIARVLAGSGREAVTDGPAEEAALAQPSGLSIDPATNTLYFADSESSAVRQFKGNEVRTLIGTGLFDFGDVDGAFPEARLQHVLGVAAWASPEGPRVIVADTYNHKLKLLDPKTRTVRTWLGVGRGAAKSDSDLKLDEPGGVFLAGEGDKARLFVADTNNHRVIVVDPKTRTWQELTIAGLQEPARQIVMGEEIPANAKPITIEVKSGQSLRLNISASVPKGAHPNAEAPMTVRARAAVAAPHEQPTMFGQQTLRTASFPISFELPSAAVKPGAKIVVELSFAYCTEGDNASCIPAEAAWIITIAEGDKSSADLK